VGSLQVTAEAGTGKTAQDGVAGVEALDREQVPGSETTPAPTSLGKPPNISGPTAIA
jgi:hypothetical protein